MKCMVERVVFRKWKDTGEVIAFLIDETEMGYVRSYMRVDQRSLVRYPHNRTVKAAPKEYAALYHELVGLGYRLRIVERGRVKYENS